MTKTPQAFSAEFKDGQVHTRKKSYSDLKYAWRVIRPSGEVIAIGFATSREHAEQSARREFNNRIDDYSIPFVSLKAPLSAWARHELNLLMAKFGVANVQELKRVVARRRREQWEQCKVEIVPAFRV